MEEKEVKTSFYIDESVLFRVKQKALYEKTTLKEVLNRYIIEGLERDEKDKEQTKLDVK